ncbi:hypothetical protein [Methanosarcina sp. 2.H.A.1B.4]|uniref:hypothetical protein n=1 Tax=Methanosarcina sp. 2.H.A.1B.4 TaxID=1483600 RepID=UPI0006228CDD|nr:hypothetical protein [Methanosarcina sp. 2.H.A.1B.4]KKG13056.1 hypothetical protein EO92_07755 [Methanosarcina sp. 2.H.A.1B.4]
MTNRYDIQIETVFSSTTGRAIIKVTGWPGKTWFENSHGKYFEDIGNKLSEDSDGNVINERGEIIDSNEDIPYSCD